MRRTLAGVILGSGSVPVSFSAGDITAAGEDKDDAELLLHTVNNVSGADGFTGVILPTGAAGQIVTVYNSEAASGLLVYPPASGTINGGSANVAIEMDAATWATFVCTDGTNWAARYTYTPT